MLFRFVLFVPVALKYGNKESCLESQVGKCVARVLVDRPEVSVLAVLCILLIAMKELKNLLTVTCSSEGFPCSRK